MTAARGYTLVEMVIALALTALLMAVLGGALYGVGQGFSKSTARADTVDRVFRISQSLRKSLSQIAPVQLGGAQRALDVANGSLSWIAPLPDSVPLPGVYRWTLTQARDKLELTLADLSGQAVFPAKPLVEDLQQFRVQLQRATNGDWVDGWEVSELPLRVRLHIRTATYGDWPVITVYLGGSL